MKKKAEREEEQEIEEWFRSGAVQKAYRVAEDLSIVRKASFNLYPRVYYIESRDALCACMHSEATSR